MRLQLSPLPMVVSATPIALDSCSKESPLSSRNSLILTDSFINNPPNQVNNRHFRLILYK